MALITLIDKLSEALDQGEIVICIFIDLSKAFGTVDNDIFHQKLELCGVKIHLWNGLIVIYLIFYNM